MDVAIHAVIMSHVFRTMWLPSDVKLPLGFKVPKLRNGRNNFCLIYWLNLKGFKLSIHHLKALAKPVQIRYCKIKIHRHLEEV